MKENTEIEALMKSKGKKNIVEEAFVPLTTYEKIGEIRDFEEENVRRALEESRL